MTNDLNEYVLYGLDNYTPSLYEMIEQFKLKAYEFDFKMILTEAIANAYYHGNDSNDSLPIYIRCKRENEAIVLEIEDCGGGIDSIDELMELDLDNIMGAGNRGLFLISCFAEKVEYEGCILRVEKIIKE